jgi:transposase-like protein
MNRKRWTVEQKRDMLERFAASGISARDFCEHEEVPYKTFLRWRQHDKRRGPARDDSRSGRQTGGARFVEVSLEQPSRPQPLVELEMGAGLVLRIWNQETRA